MKKTNSNIAFVYHYWNINNLMSYYGYKENWNQKKYSSFDIFVEHPLGENSTNTHYCSSCKQKEWKEACKKGEIYGEIIAIFIDENAGNLAHEYEHQMIITHKALYGQESLYNRNDGYAKFSTAGTTASDKTRELLSQRNKKRFEDIKEREKLSEASKNMWKNPDMRKHLIETRIGHQVSDKTKKLLSIRNKETWRSPELRQNLREQRLGEKNPNWGKKEDEEHLKERALKIKISRNTEKSKQKAKDVQYGRIFVHKDDKEKRPYPIEAEKLLKEGWILGRLPGQKRQRKSKIS